MTEQILLSWSGGKDSALALYQLLQQNKYDITLFSTITDKYRRISMHGVREILIDKQADSLGCNLEKAYISAACTNEEYQEKMAEVTNKYKNQGVTAIAFGDIFLEDVRKYREKNLLSAGIKAIFPLWGKSSRELASSFIDLNFKSIITCVDTQVLSGSFSGRYYDKDLLADFPPNIDPCGENGEFHSFVFDGPIFKNKINFSIGGKYLGNDRFLFCDLETG